MKNTKIFVGFLGLIGVGYTLYTLKKAKTIKNFEKKLDESYLVYRKFPENSNTRHYIDLGPVYLKEKVAK